METAPKMGPIGTIKRNGNLHEISKIEQIKPHFFIIFCPVCSKKSKMIPRVKSHTIIAQHFMASCKLQKSFSWVDIFVCVAKIFE